MSEPTKTPHNILDELKKDKGMIWRDAATARVDLTITLGDGQVYRVSYDQATFECHFGAAKCPHPGCCPASQSRLELKLTGTPTSPAT